MYAIRDFIYLDWERVRSFIAQLDGGVLEHQTSSSEGSTERGRDLSVKPNRIGASLSKETKFLRSESETRSLHHAIYHEFEMILDSSGLVLDPSAWSADEFQSGGFYRFPALLRLVDFQALARTARSMPRLTELASSSRATSTVQKAGNQNKSQKGKNKSKSHLEPVADLLDEVYGDLVRMILVPDEKQLDHNFCGFALPEGLDPSVKGPLAAGSNTTQRHTEALVYVYPVDPTPFPDVIPTGSQIEDAAHAAISAVGNISEKLTGITYPSIACLPLAVYRVLGATNVEPQPPASDRAEPD